MINNTLKKLISALLVVVVCLSAVPAFSFEGFAADGIELRLNKLKNDYPQGRYYNHKVKEKDDTRENVLALRDESYSKSVTKYPCVDHDKTASVGSYDCNYFDGGYQCHGFAARLFYDIFGQRQSKLERVTKKLYEIKPGDLVRLKKDTHSAIVLSVDGLKFTVAECNASGNDCCVISWGRECKVTDITYYVRASNYAEISNDTNWKNIEDKTSQGSSFYGAVVNTSSGKALTATTKGTVSFKAYSASASQVWKFEKQKNGSYKIISCLDNKALTIKDGTKGNNAEVITSAYNGSSSQLWAFYGKDKKLYLSADCGTGVITLGESNSAVTQKKSSSAAKLLTLKKEAAPSAATFKAKVSGNKVTFSWQKAENATSYIVRIYSSSKLYKEIKNIKGTSASAELPSGTYSAKIISNNSFSSTTGNTIHFTVSSNGILGKTAKVSGKSTATSITLTWTAVPGATGYRIYYKSGSKWKTAATVTKTTHKFSKLSAGKKYTFAVKAYSVKNKKTTWAKEYTEFSWSTAAALPSKITATQTTSSVTLSWSESKGADGYRVYKKTSSGWVKCADTSSKKMTVKGLSSGQGYTFAVRPYIKTASGVVWSDYKSIATATKPSAPQVTVSDVKNVSAKIQWNKVKGADGYQVYYKFDNTKYTLLGSYKSTDGGVALNNLTYGVYYTFAVRAYKKVGSTKIYGPMESVRFRAKYF